MVYDDLNKKWQPSGSSHGIAKVHIYHHFINNTFRVVGRKLQDHEVRTPGTGVVFFAEQQQLLIVIEYEPGLFFALSRTESDF